MPLDILSTVDTYLDGYGVDREARRPLQTATELEKEGWRSWLMTLFGFRFEEEFSADHVKFWNLYWTVIQRIKQQQKHFAMKLVPSGEDAEEFYFREQGIWIEPKEYVILLILGRGLAKSSTIEAAGVMRGAILGRGYNLYACEAQDQAEEHLTNCREYIEHSESRLREFYPHMAIDPNAMVQGKKAKNRADLFITIGGWICRAKGLEAKLRGLRIGGLRPDSVCVDDIDGVNDSIAVSKKKFKNLAGSLIPTQARRWATILFGQNLILETGVMNQIHTGKVDALAERTTIGVSNTFEAFREGIEYETYFDEADNRIKHRILPAAKPTWAGVSRAAAQKFLHDSGLETFLAEYQNSFEHMKTGKVFSEWDEERHIITWSMFEAKFGSRYIPGSWKCKGGADFGYSKDSLSAWDFVASAAKNTPLPGRYFVYSSRTFEMDSIDDQAVDIWEDWFPDYAVGKRHFTAQQKFANYPELTRLLSLRDRCRDLVKNYKYNPVKDKFEPKPLPQFARDWDEGDRAMFYVDQANKNFRSQITAIAISHEKTGEQKTLAQKYGIPTYKVKRHEADAGVTEANHLLHGDFTTPHPFKPDETDPNTGLYRLGCPYLFVIVDDDQYKAPRDDRGAKTFREQVAAQTWTEEKLTDLGLTRTIPLKYQSDHCDAFRMFTCDYAMPPSTPKTIKEEVEDRISEQYRYTPGQSITPEQQMSHTFAREYAEEQTKRDLGLVDDEEDEEDDYE
jgi:hypothetical protein